MTKLKILSLALLLTFTFSIANAGWFDWLRPSTGGGTIYQLDQWRATTTPVSGIAPNVAGKTIYAPYSDAYFIGLSVLGLTNCDTIDTDANGLLSCGTDASGSGTGSNWQYETNFGANALTPTSTIPVWFKDKVHASSTIEADGSITTNTGFFGDTWSSATGNSMNIKPSGDEDDFLSYKTIANRPTTKIEGGPFHFWESSSNVFTGISMRKDADHSGSLIYYKLEDQFGLSSKDPLVFKVCGDYDDYVKIYSADNIPELSVASSSGFKINAGGTNSLLLNHDGGNVGIGTATPSYELDVNGFTNTKSIHEVSSEGLVLGMNFNTETITGTAGSETVLDSSTYNNHGINHGATATSTGGFNGGGAFDFDGTDDYMDLGDNIIDWSENWTVTILVKPAGTGDSDQEIFESLNGNSGVRIQYDDIANGRIECFIGNGTGTIRPVSADISPNEWTRITLSYDGTNARLYLNGALKRTNPVVATSQTGATYLGRYFGSATTENFKGLMDNLQIYNRALSTDEIKALYLQRAEVKDSYVSQKDVFVDSSGNVGIATSTPNSTLTVDGSFAVGTNGTEFVVDSSGNLTTSGTGHDSFSDFVANEHLDWTTDLGAVNIHAGNYTDTNTTYLGGTNLTLTDTTFAVDDVFVLHAGDICTGVHDYGGATSFEIPNGTNPATTVLGQLAYDTTDNMLIIDDGTNDRVIRTDDKIFSFTLASTSPEWFNGGSLPVPPEKDGYTITSYSCYSTAGTSVVLTPSGASQGDLDAITCATTITKDTEMTAGSVIAVDELVAMKLGAITGAVDYVSFTAFGRYTRE